MKNSDKTVVVRLLKNGITTEELASFAVNNNCVQQKNGYTIPNINMYVNELFMLAKKLNESNIQTRQLIQKERIDIGL